MTTELMRKSKCVIKDPQHCSRVVRSLQTFNSQQSFTDLCFVCARGLKVYAHKLLVCAVSTQLKEMLLQVPDGLGKIIIHVPDIDSRILQLLINLLYEGNARLSPIEYELFKDSMNLLGIVLTSSSKMDDSVKRKEDPPPLLPAPLTPAPQMVYIPSSQGGVQYVLAPSSMVQSPVVQPSIIPTSTAQVQAGSQMMQLVHSSGEQMAPFSGQMMQSVNNQMTLPAGQMLKTVNSQMVQPAGQMVQPVNSPMLQPMSRMVQQSGQLLRQMLQPSGQMLQSVNSQTVQAPGQMMQSVNSQMVQPSGQMMQSMNSQIVQATGQMMQSVNSQMVQPSGQMMQSMNSQIVQATGQMMQSINSRMVQGPGQMTQHVNSQIVQPVNNIMIQQATTQMVNGAQVVVQNDKETLINNLQSQYKVHGQIGPSSSTPYQPQSSPQKANSSSPEFRERTGDFVIKRTYSKSLQSKPSTTHQAPTPTDPPGKKGSGPGMEEILSVLQEFGDIKSLSAEEFHDKLKEKLNLDISNSDIEHMIKQCLGQEEAPQTSGTPDSRKKVVRRKRRTCPPSDDEDDEDFIPYRTTKEVKKKRPS